MRFVVAILAGVLVAALTAWGLHSLMSAGDGKAGFPFALWSAPLFLGAVTAYVMANLAGNRRVAGASAEARTGALSFAATPDKARLYVSREGFIGMAAGLNITLDGAPLSQLKAPRFLSTEVEPGRHLLGAGFGGLAASQNRPAELLLEAQAGEVVVVAVGLSMGALKNTIVMQQVPLDDAVRRKLSRMKMVGVEEGG